MLRINPFIICDVAEQARFRQMVQYDEWQSTCLALGAERDALGRYDTLARAYAATTVYPNSDVVAYCRFLALSALMRGDPMPTTPKAALEGSLRKRFNI